MLIDEYIARLTALRQAHGPTLQVMQSSGMRTVRKAGLPKLAHKHKSKRGLLFTPAVDNDSLMGDPVVLL